MMPNNEIADVVNAHTAGAKIQAFSHQGIKDHEQGWVDVPNPNWDFYRVDFRIKPKPPKPREWWILPCGWNYSGPDEILDKQPAKLYLSGYIHVREVLPEEEGKA